MVRGRARDDHLPSSLGIVLRSALLLKSKPEFKALSWPSWVGIAEESELLLRENQSRQVPLGSPIAPSSVGIFPINLLFASPRVRTLVSRPNCEVAKLF